jgi:hypothetical protein
VGRTCGPSAGMFWRRPRSPARAPSTRDARCRRLPGKGSAARGLMAARDSRRTCQAAGRTARTLGRLTALFEPEEENPVAAEGARGGASRTRTGNLLVRSGARRLNKAISEGVSGCNPQPQDHPQSASLPESSGTWQRSRGDTSDGHRDRKSRRGEEARAIPSERQRRPSCGRAATRSRPRSTAVPLVDLGKTACFR